MSNVINDDSLEDLRLRIAEVGEQIAGIDEILERRFYIVEEARKARMTYREIAQLLDMSEAGLRKTQKATRSRLLELRSKAS